MAPTTTGRYRVLDRLTDQTAVRLVDLDDAEAAIESRAETDALAPLVVACDETALADLDPGNEIRATIEWDEGDATLVEYETVGRTRFYYADGVTGLFEAARDAWRDAAAANEGMNARVTRNTDGDPNGVLYVFAKQPAPQDVFSDIREGSLPIEPLVQRVEADREDDTDRAVFVFDPADESFVLVYIVFRRDGMLADTVRDTYDIGTP
ncbi:DUF6663 family protein [Haloferacaceae archaeon DSL9]